jgi:hypothetical protein
MCVGVKWHSFKEIGTREEVVWKLIVPIHYIARILGEIYVNSYEFIGPSPRLHQPSAYELEDRVLQWRGSKVTVMLVESIRLNYYDFSVQTFFPFLLHFHFLPSFSFCYKVDFPRLCLPLRSLLVSCDAISIPNLPEQPRTVRFTPSLCTGDDDMAVDKLKPPIPLSQKRFGGGVARQVTQCRQIPLALNIIK